MGATRQHQSGWRELIKTTTKTAVTNIGKSISE